MRRWKIATPGMEMEMTQTMRVGFAVTPVFHMRWLHMTTASTLVPKLSFPLVDPYLYI